MGSFATGACLGSNDDLETVVGLVSRHKKRPRSRLAEQVQSGPPAHLQHSSPDGLQHSRGEVPRAARRWTASPRRRRASRARRWCARAGMVRFRSQRSWLCFSPHAEKGRDRSFGGSYRGWRRGRLATLPLRGGSQHRTSVYRVTLVQPLGIQDCVRDGVFTDHLNGPVMPDSQWRPPPLDHGR